MKRAVHYFAQIEQQRVIIQCKTEEVNRLKAMAASIGGMDYEKERVQTSIFGDKGKDKLCKALDMEARLQKLIEKHDRTLTYITGVIDRLHEPKQIEVVYMRFLQGKSVANVAEEKGISRQRVYDISREALDRMDAIIESDKVYKS